MDRELWASFSDEQLVVAALLGDLSAFDALAVRFRPAVRAVAQSVVGVEDAEDVAQEAFLIAFKALPQLEEPGRFGAWLHSITRRRALRWQQQRPQEEPRSDIDELILAHSQALRPSPSEALEQEESNREVREEMAQLPEIYRMILRLRYWEEMPCQRIADFLGAPLTTVKWRLHYAKQLLRARLVERWQGEPEQEEE